MKEYDLLKEKVFLIACELDDIERVFQMELESIGYDDSSFIGVYNTLIDLCRYLEDEDE